MRILENRNVNGMFYGGLLELGMNGRKQDSRAGPVIVAPWPVMSVYSQPCERVLFEPARDANPFFHLMESLWMLAGREDTRFLNRYVRDFGKRFGEMVGDTDPNNDNGYIHDAYGARWRTGLGFDQLDAVVEKLQDNPPDRQCVIQMWDATVPGHDDLMGDHRGRPCNTHVYLRVRTDGVVDPNDAEFGMKDHEPRRALDLTVMCRSNDIVWGAYGANSVHFSMLQEYLAGRIGVRVGTMYQFSNNWHGYVDALDKLGDPDHMEHQDPYEDAEVRTVPIGDRWNEWDADLIAFMGWHDDIVDSKPHGVPMFANKWFAEVAVPVAATHYLWKRNGPGDRVRADAQITRCAAPDWRRACKEWMERRTK